MEKMRNVLGTLRGENFEHATLRGGKSKRATLRGEL